MHPILMMMTLMIFKFCYGSPLTQLVLEAGWTLRLISEKTGRFGQYSP